MKYLSILVMLATASFAYGNCGKCEGKHPHDPNKPDHDEIVGTIVGVNEQTQTIELMTPQGRKTLKVSEHSDLLIPGEFEGPVFDMDIEKFKRESRGKEVRIASRNGVIDHIEPADFEHDESHDGPHGGPVPPHHPGQPGPHGGPVPPHHPGQPGPHGGPAPHTGPQGGPVPPHHPGQPGPTVALYHRTLPVALLH